MTTRIVELRQGILKKNDELARGLRTQFEAAGVLVLNLVSSPGTGKAATSAPGSPPSSRRLIPRSPPPATPSMERGARRAR